MAPRRDVVVAFVADTGRFDKGADQVSGRLRGVATGIEGIAKLGAAFAGVSFFGSMISEARDAERTGRQTEAVLRSTGGAANVTAKQIGDLASKLSEKTAVDDEVIQHGENVLLTFKNIRNEAGRGNDVFNQTTAVALDMSAALSESGDASEGLQSNMIRVGKALNDPIAGISALTKVGVTFTEQQKAQIKALTEQGDVLGAQKIILSELQSEFGGMAEATADSVGKAQVSWGNFAEELGGKVMPAVNAVSDWALTTGIPTLGHIASVVGDVVTPAFHAAVGAGEGLVHMWQALPGPIQAGAVALGVWALAGDRVTGFLSRSSGPMKTFVTEVQDMQRFAAVSGVEISKLGATMEVLQARSPAIAAMGASFRKARGDVSSFGGTVKGVAMASVTGLRTAASGLIGVLGGPWGIALAGAAAVIAGFAGRSADATARQREFANAGQTVADVIREQGNVLNESVRAATAKQAADQGLLDLADRLHISGSQITSALLGQGTAYEDLTNKLRAKAEFDGGQLNTEGQLLEALGRLHTEIDNGTSKTQQISDATKEWNDETQQVSNRSNIATTSTDLFKVAIERAGIEFSESAGLAEQLKQAIDALTAAEMAQIDTLEGYEAAQDALDAAVKQNGATLNIHTEAGRRNRDALEDVAKKSRDLMQADIDSGVPMTQALKRHNDRIAALRKEARDTFGAKSQADKLITTYSKVPKDVRTAIKVTGYEAANRRMLDLSAKQTLLEKGMPITASNLRAINQEKNQQRSGGFAEGGLLSGPGGPTDDMVPIMGSPGEFMQRAAAVNYYGVSFMKALNERRVPKQALGLARGGPVVWPFPVTVRKTKIPKLTGGPALAWAASQAGKPYVWGGVGPGGYDCSGFMSAITNVIQKRNPYQRRFATGSFPTGDFASGAGRFSIGFFRGNPGHMAGTLNGVNVESRGGDGVVVGARARGARDGLFGGNVWHLRGYAKGGMISGDPPFDLLSPMGRHFKDSVKGFRDGGWLKPGQLAYNETSKPEAVFNQQQLSELKRPEVHKHFHLTMQVANHAVDVRQQFAWMEAMAGPL